LNKKNKTSHIDKALIYIKNHYHEEDLTLTKVAKEIHIHPNYLCSLFKTVIGTSFNAYLTQKRIDQAIVLIRKGMTSVVEIADMVGIPDASYFTKVFKKINVTTPTEEIRKVQKGKY
ncbi:MAG: helix-turn-helix transcriptional regulator, partial [Clostridiales bacterium]|nr:helix-turn-helix transcriptional regulator [Clostridiales bacterium]